MVFLVYYPGKWAKQRNKTVVILRHVTIHAMIECLRNLNLSSIMQYRVLVQTFGPMDRVLRSFVRFLKHYYLYLNGVFVVDGLRLATGFVNFTGAHSICILSSDSCGQLDFNLRWGRMYVTLTRNYEKVVYQLFIVPCCECKRDFVLTRILRTGIYNFNVNFP